MGTLWNTSNNHKQLGICLSNYLSFWKYRGHIHWPQDITRLRLASSCHCIARFARQPVPYLCLICIGVPKHRSCPMTWMAILLLSAPASSMEWVVRTTVLRWLIHFPWKNMNKHIYRYELIWTRRRTHNWVHLSALHLSFHSARFHFQGQYIQYVYNTYIFIYTSYIYIYT